MFFIVTAFHAEAKPIIEYFGLKKVMKPCRFQVFVGESVALVESGLGIVASAAATSFLLTEFEAGAKDAVLNIGICGAKDSSFKKGDIILCHKIINHDTKRTFYPDIIVEHKMKEAVLETFSFPVNKEEYPCSIEGDVVDMEGAGFFETASFFLPPHKIHCLKVVYDHLDSEKVEPALVSELIRGKLPLIEQLMSSISSMNARVSEDLIEKESELLGIVSQNLKLSFTMTQQLKHLVRYYLARHRKLPEALRDFANVKVSSKNEGKVYFERIKEILRR